MSSVTLMIKVRSQQHLVVWFSPREDHTEDTLLCVVFLKFYHQSLASMLKNTPQTQNSS